MSKTFQPAHLKVFQKLRMAKMVTFARSLDKAVLFGCLPKDIQEALLEYQSGTRKGWHKVFNEGFSERNPLFTWVLTKSPAEISIQGTMSSGLPVVHYFGNYGQESYPVGSAEFYWDDLQPLNVSTRSSQ